MLKRNVLVYLVVLACLGLECLIYSSFDYPLFRKNKHADITAVTQNKGLGLSPYQSGNGIGYFKLSGLDKTLYVPREYISFCPDKPNGEVRNLSLTFFLPDMESRKVFERQFSYLNKQDFQELQSSLEVETHLNAEAQAWFFLDSAIKVDICSLKDGRYDASLDLVVYKGHISIMVDEGKHLDVNEIYLSPTANPSCPNQWMICGENICSQHYSHDGLNIHTVFSRLVLPLHKIIDAKLSQKIDTFINCMDR